MDNCNDVSESQNSVTGLHTLLILGRFVFITAYISYMQEL